MKNGIRKNVVLSPISEQRIKDIRAKNDIGSDADAIREALKFYDELMQKQINGFTLQITSPDNRQIETFRPLFEPRIARNNTSP
jgi:hypothetical protein